MLWPLWGYRWHPPVSFASLTASSGTLAGRKIQTLDFIRHLYKYFEMQGTWEFLCVFSQSQLDAALLYFGRPGNSEANIAVVHI